MLRVWNPASSDPADLAQGSTFVVEIDAHLARQRISLVEMPAQLERVGAWHERVGV